MTLDRLSDGYEPRFDIDYEFGRQGELFVGDVVHALRTGGIEVKTDAVFWRTGNLYVEMYQHPRSGAVKPSGLCTTEAQLWVFVLPGASQLAIVAPTWALRDLCYEAWGARRWRASCTRGDNPTDGIALPLQALIRHMRPKSEQKGNAA